MVLSRIRELLVKQPTYPSDSATGLSAADNVQVLDLEQSTSRDLGERRPTAQSLSRHKMDVGRGSRSLTFGVDARGSGTATTLPEYNNLLLASGLASGDCDDLQFTGTTTADILVGDLLTGGTSNATFLVLKTALTGASAVRGVVISGTFSTSEAINSAFTGGSVGTSHGTTVLSLLTAKHWKPSSKQTVTITTTAAWSSDPAVGEVVVSKSGGLDEGAGIVISVNATVTVLEWSWGKVSASASLTSSSGDTATAHASTPFAQTSNVTVTAKHNRGGMSRKVDSARCDFALELSAGLQGRFNFTLTGRIGSNGDTSPLTGATLPSASAPRLAGGYVVVDGKKVPTRTVSYTPGNSVAMAGDANLAEGDSQARIGDRAPRITLNVDQLGNAVINWESKRDAGTRVAVGVQLGTTSGNTLSVVARKCQIVEVSDGDDNGTATHTITLEPQEDTAAGDDEVYYGHV